MKKRSSLTEPQSVQLAFTVQYGTKPKQIKRFSGPRVTKAFVLLEHVLFFLQKLGKKYAEPKRTFDFCVLQDNFYVVSATESEWAQSLAVNQSVKLFCLVGYVLIRVNCCFRSVCIKY